jgi:hypothetical protein
VASSGRGRDAHATHAATATASPATNTTRLASAVRRACGSSWVRGGLAGEAGDAFPGMQTEVWQGVVVGVSRRSPPTPTRAPCCRRRLPRLAGRRAPRLLSADGAGCRLPRARGA